MGELADLLRSRAGEALDLHAEYANPQMIRVLRTIGFDRDWVRTEGAYLYDSGGERYLDWLGGFGMFNVGRSNPRVRDWLIEAMERQTPNAPQMGISPGARRRRSGRRSSRRAAPSRSRRRSSSAVRRRSASASSASSTPSTGSRL